MVLLYIAELKLPFNAGLKLFLLFMHRCVNFKIKSSGLMVIH